MKERSIEKHLNMSICHTENVSYPGEKLLKTRLVLEMQNLPCEFGRRLFTRSERYG